MVIINMLDGEKIEIHQDTILVGINNVPKSDIPKENMFYLERLYIGNLQGDYEEEGSALATTDERLGIGGFLLSHDMFSIGEGYNKTYYFTTAVKSISVV